MNADGDFPRFGPYLIVRTSGSGGMGRVQLALRTDGSEPQLCILKRRHQEERAPEQDARFKREVRIAARLSHENIAQTLQVESIDGELCLVQEFVEGMNISRLLRQTGTQPIPEWAAVHVVREVANALTYAHDLGELDIVHRDVTPENVMLSYTGEVKLIDFGISRSRIDGTLTSIGAVVGRRAYVPPEVWAGAKPDRRADIFALGVVLWEMLTAHRLEEMDERIWSESVPDPRSVRSDLPAELAALVMRAVAPDPAARYQTAAELRTDLASFIDPAKDQRLELATLLAFYFNVGRARALLAEQINDAKSVLRVSSTSSPVRFPATRGLCIAAVVAGVVFASGVAISGLRRTSTHSRPNAGRVAGAIAPKVGGPTAVASEAPTKSLATTLGPSVAMTSPVPAKPRHVGGAREVALATNGRQESTDAVLRKAGEEFDDGHLSDALSLARKAAASGGGARAYALLGYIYMSKGELAGAERELSQAVRLNPGDAEAVRRLADVQRARAEQDQ